MSGDNKAIIRRWFDEVWNNGREATIDELMASHCVIHGLGPEDMGRAEFKKFYHSYRNALPDVVVELDQIVAEGDLVAACWTAAGTNRGDGLGFAATNKRAEFGGMTFARVANGQIVEGWNSFDQLGMLVQLGVVAPPG